MSAGELTPYQLHGMHPVLAVPHVDATVGYYRDMLGFHVDLVHGDPPWSLRQFIIEDCNGYLISFSAEIPPAQQATAAVGQRLRLALVESGFPLGRHSGPRRRYPQAARPVRPAAWSEA